MTALAHIMPGPPPVDPRADAIEREVERLRADRAWLAEQLAERIADDSSTRAAETVLAALDAWPAIERLPDPLNIYDWGRLTRLYQSTKGYRMDIDDLVLAEATRRVDAEIYAAEDE